MVRGQLEMAGFRSIALAGVVLAICLGKGWAQVNANQPDQPVRMFLDQAPTDADRSRLPPMARDVVIAKVRIVGGPWWTGGRDQSGAPSPPVRTVLAVRALITNVVEGNAKVFSEEMLHFRSYGVIAKFMYPVTPHQKTLEYFVLSYRDTDDSRRLVDFPVAVGSYEDWEREVSDYRRSRGRPGVIDH